MTTFNSSLGLETDFKEFFTASVAIYKKTGTNQYGENTFLAAPAIYPAMIVRMTKQVRTKDNQVKVSNAQVYLEGDYVVDPDDKIQLPDASTPVILHIAAYSDTKGPYLQVVYT